MAAARAVAPLLKNNAVVVVKSTVPVGTGDAVEKIITSVRQPGSFSVRSNPEFLREELGHSTISCFPIASSSASKTRSARKPLMALYRPSCLSTTTDRRDAAPFGGADQIRLECLSGDQDHVHQRTDRSLREKGRPPPKKNPIGELALGVGVDHASAAPS